MKREILFKGKRIIDGKLIEGLYCKIFNRKCELSDHIQYFSSDENTIHYCEVIPETLGQFTGLTDKNGVKIFGDDLRKDSDGKIFRIYHVYGGFIMKAHYWKNDIADLIPMDQLIFMPLSEPQTAQWLRESTEHFGNIYDNSELLNS